MMNQISLLKNINNIEIAIKRIKEFEPHEGYWLAFSGGKDSIVIHRLAEMAGTKNIIKEFERYPKFKKLYLMTFEKMLVERKKRGLETNWNNADDVFNWWISNQKISKICDNQININELRL